MNELSQHLAAISDVADIARVIQLAVAPVFLLASVGAMLTVLTNRLARIVDRARVIEEELKGADEMRHKDIHEEFIKLRLRANLISRAIVLATSTGLLICLVVAALFLAHLLDFRLSIAIALLFIAAMASFAGAFILFLREIFYATARMRFGPEPK